MSNTPILVELKPDAAQDVALFTANASTAATGTVFCLNQAETVDMVSVALVSNGNVLTSNSYITFETEAFYGQSIYLQELYIGDGDTISVRSENGTSNFIFTGTKFP